MGKDSIKRALHSLIDGMDEKLRKTAKKSIFLYFRIERATEQ